METLSINRASSILRAGKVSEPQSRRERKNVHRDKAYPLSFLTERIDDIRSIDLMDVKAILDMDLSINEVANVANLISATGQWLRLNNLPVPELAGRGLFDTIANCFRAIHPHLPKHHGLNVDFNQNTKEFILIEYSTCKFPYDTVFYFPISPINRYKGPMRKLIVQFVAFLQTNSPFNWADDSYDFSMILELYEESKDYFEEDMLKCIDIYQNGEYQKLQSEIISARKDNLLEKILSGMERLPECDKKTYSKLLESIKAGIQILSEDKLYRYQYFPNDSTIPSMTNDDDESNLSLNRLFVMCYDINDPIVDAALTSITEDAEIISTEEVMDYHVIRPDDKAVFKASDYPDRWAKWFNDFYDEYQNEQID